jgi:hypothetical protein
MYNGADPKQYAGKISGKGLNLVDGFEHFAEKEN